MQPIHDSHIQASRRGAETNQRENRRSIVLQFVLSVQRVYVTQVTGKEPINVYTNQAETASLKYKLNALEEQLRSLQTSESDEDSNPN